MAKKNEQSPVFEIFVVLAIVAIVAVTGQILMKYEQGDASITGFAVAEYEEEPAEPEFIDIGVEDIEVNPPSPLIGEPFEIKVIVANKGFNEINTPFYVDAKLIPNGENVEPTILHFIITQALKPGDKATAVFKIATVTKEGPLKIIATADSTAKLSDNNPRNDVRSKTIILNIQ